jgi:hypothetical protein
MNRLLLVSTAALALAGLAAPAFADDSGAGGSVAINGSVAGRCVNTGDAAPALDVGELAGNDGKAVTQFTTPAGSLIAKFTIICNTAKPTVAISATPLVFTAASIPNGYTNTVNYRATVTPYLSTYAANSVSPYVWTGNESPGVPSTQLTGALATAQNNIQVTVDHPYSNGNVLMAGAYSGQVTVTVTPTS